MSQQIKTVFIMNEELNTSTLPDDYEIVFVREAIRECSYQIFREGRGVVGESGFREGLEFVCIVKKNELKLDCFGTPQ